MVRSITDDAASTSCIKEQKRLMKHTIKHGISDELAKKATKKAFESYIERFSDFNPQADWVSEKKANIAFSVKGKKLDGTVDLLPGAIDLEMSVPFLFKPFEKKAVGVIESEIQKWIERAKNGELDD